MKALVTGATGFIGARLVQALSDRGDEIRALVFPGEDLSHITAHVAEIREGDITDPSTLDGIGEGIDVVYRFCQVGAVDDNRYQVTSPGSPSVRRT